MLSPAIEAVVMKALAKKPEQRYASAGQLAQALSAAAGIAPVQAPQAAHGKASAILAPMILTSEDTLPKVPTPSAHEANTVFDTIQGIDRQTSPASGRQFSSSPAHYPAAARQRAGHPSWQAAIFGIMLILLLIFGGSLAYLYFALKGPSAARVSQTHSSPTSTTTISTPTPTTPAELPAPEIAAGKLLYGTQLPGFPCDTAHGSWSVTANARVTCSTSATELANTNSHHLAGTFLGSLPNGRGIPNDYILQVQVREGPPSHGAFEVLFRNQAGSPNLGAYSFTLSPNNNWSANAYDNSTRTETQFYSHQTTVRLQGLITIDIRVQGDTYILYINGREQGNAISPHYPSGTVGLAVDPGADVFFSNFALYALPNK
jgi:hypothetical protein